MKITERIHQLKIDFTIHINDQIKVPRSVNVFVVFGEEITLIDSGVIGSEKEIFEYIEANGRKVKEIKTLLFSHAHPDHIGAANKIKEITGCKVYSSECEREWIENIELQNSIRTVPGFFKLVDESCSVDSTLIDNQILELDKDISVKCIPTPGHSKGSISYLFEEDKVLFTGDTVTLNNDIPNYDNYFELLESLDKIESLAADKILLTSFTEPLTSEKQKLEVFAESRNYLSRIDKTVKEIYNNNNFDELKSCKKVLEKLELPPFLAGSLVNNTFVSHIEKRA